MKYVVIQKCEDGEIKLTRPSTKSQAFNSLYGLMSIGIPDIEVRAANKKSSPVEESVEDFIRAKKDFEAQT
jgi:hypothetical protein